MSTTVSQQASSAAAATTTYAPPAPAAAGPPPPPPPAPVAERIGVLDVLRGIALLGMYVVHFHYYMNPSDAGAGPAVQRVVELFFEERFWATFAFLFGVGFAIQLRRADARGERLGPRYVRRMLALLAFGVVAEVGFGYHVLVEYALWGLPLLLVRRWPTRRLVVLLVACAMSLATYSVARSAYGVYRYGNEGWRARAEAHAAADAAFRKRIEAAKESPRYATVVAARVRRMPWWYTRPFSLLPVTDFPLFLAGLLALRLGLLEWPREHQRLVVGLMVFGVASWAAATWVLPRFEPGPPGPGEPLVRYALVTQLSWGCFGLVRTMWLAFAYVGAVLLLVARNPATWLRRLAPLAWTGRMALTNYLLQVMVLDLAFSNYALGLTIRPLAVPVAALALFGAQALASRWWLARYRFGPCEWLWRCVTYWRRQPFRLAAAAAAPPPA